MKTYKQTTTKKEEAFLRKKNYGLEKVFNNFTKGKRAF